MFQQQQVVKLTQQQSSILDNLTWEEKGKTINYNDKKTGEPKSFYKKYADCQFSNDTLEAQNIFIDLNTESVENYAGIYRYTVGKDRFFRNKIGSSSSGGGSSSYKPKGSNSSGILSDGAKKGHEENVAMHEEKKKWHEEDMQKLDSLILTLGAVKDTLEIVGKKLERIQ